ncbi:hypothetical protein THRCLA_04678 [Thraustotheca clavata]|uniref:Uncharacterized protein n=1 Tax=Thraustotheca clavata TaxID=74557 RepID=A0A1V9ZYB2_9STRA|nr:hypothetical protein THRCLA_04678 [Thraustotheca clavata]
MPLTERVPLSLRVSQAIFGALSLIGLLCSLQFDVAYIVALIALALAICNTSAWLLVRYRTNGPMARKFALDAASAIALIIAGIVQLLGSQPAVFSAVCMFICSVLFIAMMAWNKYHPQAKKVMLVVSPKNQQNADDELTENAYVVLETPGRSLECVI